MDKKNNQYSKDNNYNMEEDSTKYGEFISSYFGWTTPEKQKEKAKKMDEMTKNDKKINT